MIELSSGSLEWIGVGAVVALAGWLIRFRGWTFLVAGYDTTAPLPDDVVADIAGSTVLRVGIATAALGVLRIGTEIPSTLRVLFGLLVLGAVVRMIYRLRTYTPAETT